MAETKTISDLLSVIEAKRLLNPPKPQRDDRLDLRESISRLRELRSKSDGPTARWSELQLAAKGRSDQLERERIGREHLDRAGVPRLHRRRLGALRRDGAFASWGAQWDALAEMVDRPDGCLVVLAGTRGAGKTQLGVCAIERACMRGASALYIEAPFLFMQIRDSFKGAGGEAECYRRFTTPKMLFVDQLEERKHSDAEDRMLFTIVNKRYAEARHTILASNENLAALSSSLGSSLVGRINEVGMFMECAWEDLRNV